VRVEVTSGQIEDFSREAMSVSEGIPAHFVHIEDEMGHQEWTDRMTHIFLVPAFHLDDHVNVPIPRTGKMLTVAVCIATEGSFLKPTVIIHKKLSMMILF
jgi:hypothetical protein